MDFGFASHVIMDNNAENGAGESRWIMHGNDPDDTARHFHGDRRLRIRGNNQCDPCLFDNDVIQANGFCVSCLENLCEDCVKSHTKSKFTRRHIVLTGRNIADGVKAKQILACAVSCLDHPGQEFDRFCLDHGSYVCVKCIEKSHRKCHTLEEITKVSNAKVDRQKFEHSFQDLYAIKEQSAAKKLEKRNNIHYIRREQCFVKEGVCCLASLVYDLLLQDGTKSPDMVNQLVAEKITCLEREIAELEEFERDQIAILRMMDAALEHGSEKHIQVIMSRVNSHTKSIAVAVEALDLRYNIEHDHQRECTDKVTKEQMDKRFPEQHIKIDKESIAAKEKLPVPNRTSGSEDADGILTSKVEHPAFVGNMEATEEDVGDLSARETEHSADGDSMESTEQDISNTSDSSMSDIQSVTSVHDTLHERTEGHSIATHTSATVNKHGHSSLESNVCHTVPKIPTSTFSAKTDNVVQRNSLMERGIRFVAKYKAAGKRDKTTCSISGIVVLPNGKFVMTDCKNNWVKVYNGDFKCEFGSKLSFRPNDLCHYGISEVILAGGTTVERYTVNDSKLTFNGSFQTKGECYAVSKHGTNIAILCVDGDRCEIQICQKYNGTILSTISKFHDRQKSVLNMDALSLLYSENNGYIVGDQKNIVRCFNGNGIERWYYKGRSKRKLMCVSGLAEDTEGNLYACGGRSNNLHQISGDDFMDNRIIFSGLPGPVSVAVDQHRDRIVVGCKDDDYVHVYEFV